MVLYRLLLTIGLSVLNGAVLTEPLRANEQETNFTLYNGTPYNLKFENGYMEDEWVLPPNTSLAINSTYHASDDWWVYMREDWNSADSMWYECLDSIGLPDTPNWRHIQYEWQSNFNVRGLISTAHGIGVYTYKYYDNQDLYIDPNQWGGIGKGLNDYTGTITITPSNVSNIKVYKENGTYNTATKICAKRAAFEESFNYATIVYAVINGQNIMMANNFGYTQNIISGTPAPSNPMAIQPYLTYYNGWTNRVSLGTAELQKDAEVNPYTGYERYGYPYLSENAIGYIAIGNDSETNTTYALTAGFTFAYMAFSAIAPLFSFIIFPGISIGLLITIPLIMTVMYAVIKLIKKGG